MLKLPPILAELGSYIVASFFAILGIYKILPALIKLWQERDIPKAEQELRHAQAVKVTAEAGEVEARRDISLMQVALNLAASARDENDDLKRQVRELEQRCETCRLELSKLTQRGNGKG
jgi:hypothetical protein